MRIKFLGTEIYISFLFCAVLCLMLIFDRTGLIIPTLFAVFIHESGHLLAMWAADCQPRAIRLIPTSVQIVREFSCKKRAEIAISICGPAANLILFFVLLINYLVFASQQSLVFAVINVVMAAFNLLPVLGLDGGTLLIECLSRFTDIYKAESIVRLITAIFAFAAFLIGVYLWVSGKANISIFIMATYLTICALIKK